jgi:hypothetical protein
LKSRDVDPDLGALTHIILRIFAALFEKVRPRLGKRRRGAHTELGRKSFLGVHFGEDYFKKKLIYSIGVMFKIIVINK